MALSQDPILEIIFQSLANLNAERDASDQVPVGIETQLFGGNSVLDSLALVSVISDVEMGVSDAMGEVITLTDDRAMSQKISPFTNVRTLCAYILSLDDGKA